MGARLSFIAWILALAPGCFASVDGGAAYVVADREARDLGTTVGGEALPVRPVIVASGEIEIARPGTPPERVRIETGDVVALRGASVVRFAPDEVRPDVLLVRAPEADARALARAIDAELFTDGDLFRLTGPDAVARAAALASDPAGVVEMLPVAIDSTLDAPTDDTRVVQLADLSVREVVSPLGSTSPLEAEAVRLLDVTLFQMASPFTLATHSATTGRFAMRLAQQQESGCSRGGSSTSASGAVVLEMSADGRASACASHRSTSHYFSAERDESGLIRSDSGVRASRVRTGYRGAWRHLEDGAIALALVPDATVCAPIAEGVGPTTAPLLLRCIAASGADSTRNIQLPETGLACAVVRDPYSFGPTLDGGYLYLGTGEGWDVRAESWRYDGSVVVTPATAPIDPLAI